MARFCNSYAAKINLWQNILYVVVNSYRFFVKHHYKFGDLRDSTSLRLFALKTGIQHDE